jgi:choline dehydrogenase-like flavoprotein
VLRAAGAIETPAILLRSRADLPDLSPHVGKNFSNNGDVAWYFALPEGHRFPRYRLWAGRNNAVMITYAFWDEHRITIHTGSNPPGVIAAVDIAREGGLPYGLAHKRLMRELYPSRLVGAIAIGLAPATGEVTIDGRGNVHVSLPLTPELGAYMDRVIGVARQMAAANGAEILRTAREGYERGGAHPLGTCRMGDDPRESVTTPEGEVRGTPGLFVTDASTLPGGTGANPALTIAANAERIARRIVERT